MAAPVQAWQRSVGIGKETTWGTAVAPTDGIPINTPVLNDDPAEILDDGYRGDAAKDQGYYQGVWTSAFSGAIPGLYADSGGHFLMGIMGADSVTGAGPYTHAIKLATGLPPSYTWSDFTSATSGGQARQYPGHYFSDVSLQFTAANELLKIAPKSIGKKSAIVAKPSETYTTQAPFLGWQGALTLNSAANARMKSCTIDLKRTISMEKGSGGTQDPDFASVGQLEVTGKAQFIMVDETDMLLELNNTQPIFSLLFTSGANTLTATMSKCAMKGTQTVAGDLLIYDVTFRGIKNTTDAGPIQFSLVNTKSAAF
jgi:hypothetical protein